MVAGDDISASPSSDSTYTPRKMVSGNSCKILRTIQRSNQKLWTFRTGTMVAGDDTSASASSDSTSTPRKTASGNSCKILREIQRSDRKLWPFRTRTPVSSDDPSASSSSFPHLLLGKRSPETPVNFEGDPTEGSKVMALSNGYYGRGRRYLCIAE
jgi:hypothetical protein